MSVLSGPLAGRAVAGGWGRGQGRADQHAAAVRADPDDRRRDFPRRYGLGARVR